MSSCTSVRINGDQLPAFYAEMIGLEKKIEKTRLGCLSALSTPEMSSVFAGVWNMILNSKITKIMAFPFLLLRGREKGA